MGTWPAPLRPDISKERVESREQRRELLRIEVSAIVKDMLERGEQPAQAVYERCLAKTL